MRGYAKEGVAQAVREAGGEIYAITSEPHTLARNAQDDWQTGLIHVGDPHQEISGACADRGWLSLFTNPLGAGFEEKSVAPWISHPKGHFQPGVLALSEAGRVLYRWRCRPDRSNVGGAIARPTAGHVWRRVRAALREPADTPDVALDTEPELDSPPVPWPLFLLLLLANGWFLGPAFFDQRPGEDTVPKRQRKALLRIPLFFAAWIVAGFLLPLWVVALAFAGWVASVAPAIRRVHERFQNVGPHEEPA